MGQSATALVPDYCPCSESKDKDTIVFANTRYDPDAAVQAAPSPVPSPPEPPAAVDLKAQQVPQQQPQQRIPMMEIPGMDLEPLPPPATMEIKAESPGLVDQVQGTWYREEDGNSIGTIKRDRIMWEDSFDCPASKVWATSAASLSMELVGEIHNAKFVEGPGSAQKLIWSD